MINSIKKYIRNNRTLLIYLTLYLFLFILIFYLIGNRSFMISNDNCYQYEIFYNEWIKIIKNFLKTGQFNTYSFNMFLGTDFYSSMGYYCIGDIFLPILLLFRNNISIGLFIETIICIYISAILMSLFLNKKGIKNKNVILYISFLYAIGGQAILYIQNYMFHRFFAFLPLLFLGLEYYFQNKKRIIFIIATFILFTQNYYFMYMTLIFLFFYALIECLSNELSIKQIIVNFFDLLLSLLIGFLLSCIVVLPSMTSIIGNVTSRRASNDIKFWEINAKLGILSSILHLNAYGTNNFYNLSYDFHGSWYNLFITIIPLSFIVLNITNKNYLKRNLFLIVTLIVAEIKPLNSIMHGFSYPSLRWLFLLEFYLLYLSAMYMDLEYDKKKLLKVMFFIILIDISFLVILYFSGYITLESKGYLIYVLICIFTNILLIMIYKYNKILSCSLSILFILFSTFYYYNGKNAHNYIPLISKNEIEYNQNYDNTYYRYYYSYMNTYDNSPLDANSSLLYNIMTTSTYSSTYDTTIDKFLNLSQNIISLDWNIEISNSDALTMLGTKYYIVGDRIKDQYLSNPLLEYKYTLRSIGEFEVHYNKNYRGFGYCAENVDYTDNFGRDSNKNFINTVFIDDNSINLLKYKNISYSPLDIKYMNDNYVYAEINNSEDNILLIPFPNNKGWNITVNGSQVKPISVNGGFIGLELNKGFNEIEMRFSTPYLKQGAMLSCVGLVIFAFVIIKEKKRT